MHTHNNHAQHGKLTRSTSHVRFPIAPRNKEPYFPARYTHAICFFFLQVSYGCHEGSLRTRCGRCGWPCECASLTPSRYWWRGAQRTALHRDRGPLLNEARPCCQWSRAMLGTGSAPGTLFPWRRWSRARSCLWKGRTRTHISKKKAKSSRCGSCPVNTVSGHDDEKRVTHLFAAGWSHRGELISTCLCTDPSMMAP